MNGLKYFLLQLKDWRMKKVLVVKGYRVVGWNTRDRGFNPWWLQKINKRLNDSDLLLVGGGSTSIGDPITATSVGISVTRLGKFLKPLATINLPISPTFLGNFWKGVKIYHFWATFIHIWWFFLVTLVGIDKVTTRLNCVHDTTSRY